MSEHIADLIWRKRDQLFGITVDHSVLHDASPDLLIDTTVRRRKDAQVEVAVVVFIPSYCTIFWYIVLQIKHGVCNMKINHLQPRLQRF